MVEQIVALIVGIFFGTCLGFMLCLGLMFWLGVIGNDLREFIGAQIDQFLNEIKELNNKWE